MSIEYFSKLEKERKYPEILDKFSSIKKEELSTNDFNLISFIVAKASFIKGNIKKTLEILTYVLPWAKKNEKTVFISAMNLKANSFSIQGRFEEAQKVFEELFSESENIENIDFYASLISNYGHTLFYQGKILEAHEKYLQALEISKEKQLRDDQILNNLVLTYNQLGEYEKAINIANEVVRKKELLNDWKGWIIVKVNLSAIYSYIEKFKEANEMVDVAIKFAEEKLFIRELAGAYSVKGLILIREKKILESHDYLLKARIILEKNNVKDILPEALVRLGFVTILLERYNETKEIIKKLEELAEIQQSSKYVIWSTCLESLLWYERKSIKEALKMTEAALSIALDMKLLHIFFQTTYLVTYLYVASNELPAAKKVLEKAIEIAREQQNKYDTLKFSLALGFLYMIMGENEKLSLTLDKLEILSEEEKIYSKDIQLLNNYILDINQVDSQEYSDTIIANVKDSFLDYLQRTNPWF
ncbi:MAG: tetratricopeptide repeat protein [Candidatus Heimdallarchaeaceae archaeon]